MKPHQQRVVEEKKELDERRQSLVSLKHRSFRIFALAKEQERLNTQAHIMTMYSAVLGERIAAFERQPAGRNLGNKCRVCPGRNHGGANTGGIWLCMKRWFGDSAKARHRPWQDWH